VPYFSTLLVAALLVVSLMLLALLVQRISQLQITQVLRMVGNQGRKAIRETYPVLGDKTIFEAKTVRQRAEQIQSRPPLQVLRYSGEPHAIEDFDVGAFVRLAHDAGAVITMECAVGDTIADGSLLMRVFGVGDRISDEALMGGIHLAWDRTFEQDPKYPLRLLVDTAIMALSPAVNDPTTAVQSIDQIEDLLHRLGRCDLDIGYAKDANGDLRFVYPVPTWEDYLSLAFDEISLFGGQSLQVLRRLRSALNDLSDGLTDAERVHAVRHHLHHLNDAIAHSGLDELHRVTALHEDRQGLGVTRRGR
jgi:uncharacterized membrane protein